MKRRELSAALLLGAAGAGISTARATVQPGCAQCPPGNVLNYGADPTGSSSSSAAFAQALAAHREIYVPRGTYRVSNISLDWAGCTIRGESRWESRLIPEIPGEPMFHFSASTGSSFGHLIENLKFQMHEDQSALTIPAIGVLLGSINNTAVRSCRFEGGSTVDANAVGVVFSAPNNQASYSNTVMDCNFVNLGVGVRYDKNANQNNIFAGEFIQCLTGVDAAPPDGPVDTPKIFGSRIEGCGTGLRECADQGMYFGVRFENNGIDVDFIRYQTSPGVYRVPTDTHFFGGSTAVSNPCFNNPQYVSGLVCLAPELSGNLLRANSASRPNQLIGPNVFAPLGDAGTTVHPPGSGAAAAYFRGGRVVLDNQQWLVGRNQAGTGIVFGMSVNASDVLQMGASGKVDIGNTDGDHRTRVFKPCFLTSGSATGGSIVNKFPVYNASGSLIGYVPIYSS